MRLRASAGHYLRPGLKRIGSYRNCSHTTCFDDRNRRANAHRCLYATATRLAFHPHNCGHFIVIEDDQEDRELSDFGNKLDGILLSRGWNPRAARRAQTMFELSAVRIGDGRVRLTLEATLTEAVAAQIIQIAARHGMASQDGRTQPL